MVIKNFSLSRLPRIEFGAGAFDSLPGIVRKYGTRALIVTGAHSFRASRFWPALTSDFQAQGVSWQTLEIAGEPSPHMVDKAVVALRAERIDVVVGIGGGSALDAAKAIAGLLKPGNSVMDHLEGVGPERAYFGPATPFIAVPTTAGTGSEATKNAVLSLQGADGFKKSFRDDKLVAEYALVDPDLLASCPPAVIAANGMDALTQLLESYVSTRAAPFTDSLAWGGMKAARDGLLALHADTNDAKARERMAYAAMCRVSRSLRRVWDRSMAWPHLWVHFFRFRTAQHAEPWWPPPRVSISKACARAMPATLRCKNMREWAACSASGSNSTSATRTPF